MSRITKKLKRKTNMFKQYFDTPLKAFIMIGCLLVAFLMIMSPALVYLSIRLEGM